MNVTELEKLFPSEDQIPAEYNLTEPIEQREYLVNGEMRTWAGKNARRLVTYLFENRERIRTETYWFIPNYRPCRCHGSIGCSR